VLKELNFPIKICVQAELLLTIFLSELPIVVEDRDTSNHSKVEVSQNVANTPLNHLFL
jgi:hypothetical protein